MFRHALDVVHQTDRIAEHVRIDFLKNVADVLSALTVGQLIGVVDVPVSVRLDGDEIPIEPELRTDRLKIIVRIHHTLSLPEKILGINAGFDQCAETVLNHRLVLLVGHAEPGVGGGQDFDSGPALLNQLVRDKRNVKFALELGGVFLQKRAEESFQFSEEGGLEPHMFMETTSLPVNSTWEPSSSVLRILPFTLSIRVCSTTSFRVPSAFREQMPRETEPFSDRVFRRKNPHMQNSSRAAESSPSASLR